MTTMMMKNPMALVACILLFSSLTVLASDNTFGPDKCCFKFYTQPLPKKGVVNFKFTDKLCSMEGVLFIMKRGNEICADPNQKWVRDLIEAKEKKTYKRVTRSSTRASE